MKHFPKTRDLIDLSHTLAAPLLEKHEYPWGVLDKLGDFILSVGASLDPERFISTKSGVWIAKNAKIAPTAYIDGPCIIGENTEVRHCAFIRGGALVGDGAVIGNSTELKNCIICDGAQIPHFNYVGDSVIGYRAHLGAGAVTSNVKSDKNPVTVKLDGQVITTGRRKLGATVGDFAEIGCGAVLNPGTVIGRRTSVYPQVSVRGVVAEDHIVKSDTLSVRRR